MKASKVTTVKKAGLALLTALFLTTSIFAADSSTGNYKLSKDAKHNIVQGIKSPNFGVKRDCIYYSAIYNIKEAVDVLKEELEKENDPRTNVLITLALYKLGETNVPGEIYGAALVEWNEKVKFISDEIVNLYKNQKDAVASYNGD